MTNLDDKIEIMMWKKHHTNSRICKRKEKKKARITQLKIYINRRVFLAMGRSNNKARRSERSLNRSKREERKIIMI